MAKLMFEFDAVSVKPVAYFGYTTLIDGTWKPREYWELKAGYFGKQVLQLLDKAKLEVESRDIIWDNKCAAMCIDRTTSKPIYIGEKDGNICIGDSISFMDSWIKPLSLV